MYWTLVLVPVVVAFFAAEPNAVYGEESCKWVECQKLCQKLHKHAQCTLGKKGWDYCVCTWFENGNWS